MSDERDGVDVDALLESGEMRRVAPHGRRRGLSRWGQAGFLLLGVHTALLLLPPFGPNIKGPLISFFAAYTTVFLLLIEASRQWPGIAEAWSRMTSARRRTVGLGLAIGTMGFWLAWRALDPERFRVFNAEFGLVEPATLFCYWSTAIALIAFARRLERRERRHWLFVGALYALMGLEEIDYFGIFGSVIGRVDGVYAGSLHDLIRLITEGVLGPIGILVVAGVAGVVFLALWRGGYVQPREISALVSSRDIYWVLLAAILYVIAAADDAHLFGWQANPPYEEVVELGAAICLVVFALQILRRRIART